MTAWTFVPFLFALIYLWDSLVAMSRAARSALRAALGTAAVTGHPLPAEHETVPN